MTKYRLIIEDEYIDFEAYHAFISYEKGRRTLNIELPLLKDGDNKKVDTPPGSYFDLHFYAPEGALFVYDEENDGWDGVYV